MYSGVLDKMRLLTEAFSTNIIKVAHKRPFVKMNPLVLDKSWLQTKRLFTQRAVEILSIFRFYSRWIMIVITLCRLNLWVLTIDCAFSFTFVNLLIWDCVYLSRNLNVALWRLNEWWSCWIIWAWLGRVCDIRLRWNWNLRDLNGCNLKMNESSKYFQYELLVDLLGSQLRL